LPPDVPANFYDVTVQADLLKTDKRTVLASAYAPVRRLPVRMPVVVQVVGAPQVEAQLIAQKEATTMVPGKVERREGLTGDIILAVTGLPAGVRADAVTVKTHALDCVCTTLLAT